MDFKYNIVGHGDTVNVTAFINGQMYIADSNHPAISDILSLIAAGDRDVIHLFDATESVTRRLRNYTDKVQITGGKVTYNGTVLENSITNAILRVSRTGASFKGLVNFLGRVDANPNQHSKDQLFDWLRDRDFTITEDGCFIAYKGLTDNGSSVHSGPGVVDGVAMNGHLPNKPGTVVSMARESVQHDSHIGCSVGLHVGTWEYASSFGYGVTAKIKVDPADVVSVPTDCAAQKMRVCRYEVLEYIDAPVTDVYDGDYEESSEDDSLTLDGAWGYDDMGVGYHILNEYDVEGRTGSYVITEFEDENGHTWFDCDCPSYVYGKARPCRHMIDLDTDSVDEPLEAKEFQDTVFVSGYTVDISVKDGQTTVTNCSCKGWRYRKTCKHATEVASIY